MKGRGQLLFAALCGLRCLIRTMGEEELVFAESFQSLDVNAWKHEITMAGGGNWEFQYYTNNRSNSFVDEGVLYLQPTLTADLIGERCVTGDDPMTMSLWGLSPADQCTSNAYYGCERASNKGARLAINPIQSARITTAGRFTIKYGRVEVVAKLPVGDWLWPAIWLLPEDNAYGSWPASGEIDMVESRGNAKGYCSINTGLCPGGNDAMSSTLHWGPFSALNSYPLTTGSFSLEDNKSFGDDFHTFGLSWDENGLYTYVDRDDNRVLSVTFDQSFWERGEFSKFEGVDNPWAGRPKAAPFDKGFFLVMNVAVGGVGGFFPDDEGVKPWSDSDPDAALKFWESKDQWYPTWKGRDSALQVKSVKIWQKPGGKEEYFTKEQCHCSPGDQSQPAPEGLEPKDSSEEREGTHRHKAEGSTAPPNVNSTLKLVFALTVINTVVLVVAIASWTSSSVFGRRPCSCIGATRSKARAKKGARGGFHRLSQDTMSPAHDPRQMELS